MKHRIYSTKASKDFLSANALIDRIKQIGSSALPHHLIGDLNEEYQWLLFRRTDEQYKVEYFDFPSDYIKGEVCEKLRNLEPDIMEKFTTDNIAIGRMYKFYVRKYYLGAGKNIMNDDKDYYIQKHVFFTSKQVFGTIALSTLYVPMERNKEGFDFVYPPFLFQCTHQATAKNSNVEKVEKQFPQVKNWKMCFIVPTQRKNVNHKVKQGIPSINLVFDFPTSLCKAT